VADTRERILTATNESFRRRGYHGTSLRDVATGAAAPIGSLYHFFPGGKDELTVATLIWSGDAYRRLFEMIAEAAANPAVAITDFFDGAAAVLRETDFIDPCPIGTVAREVASTNDAIRAATDHVFATWIAAAAMHFEAAGMTASEAEQLATTVVAALEGGFVLARARRDPEPLLRVGRSMRRLVEDELAAASMTTRTERDPASAP
jgi:AcrR family transcriptional regulator